jgi:transcriptional regulator with XRE-family HTH domain
MEMKKDMKMKNLGIKIRNERRLLGWSIKQMAEKLSISTMTLHRIETEKKSPSVALLAEIAHLLRRQINFFIAEETPKFLLIKKDQHTVIESPKMRLTIIAPKGLIGENIYLSLGEAQKGKFVDSHVNEGYSLVHVLDGSCVFEHDGKKYLQRKGDTIYYDARYRHSVTANGRARFISIFFKNR